jgi:PH domain/START domain
MTTLSPNNTSVLDYLSFEAEAGDITNLHMSSSSRNAMRMQGVLWKRRDVFRNRWRPRWFVLHPEQHILTYYLLTGNGNGDAPQQVTSNRNNSRSTTGSNRRRTYSESSNVSENTVDYDVVPRGTIYLLGSTVEANEALTRAEEELFVLSISDHEHATHVHLAARTPEARSQWIRHIRAVCSSASSRPSQPHDISTTSNRSITNNSNMYTTPPRPTHGARNNQNRTAHSPSTPLYNQTLLESPSMMSQATADNSVTASGWKILYTEHLFQDVPTQLQQQLEDVLQTYLPHVEDLDNPEWKLRYDSNGVHCSVRRDVQGRPMMRSIRRGTNHHPIEYLKAVWDLSSALEYETNVHSQHSLQTYNANTSLVYKAYEPVWPTSPRDFATAAFWTLLQRNHNGLEERALCVVAVSCPQAEEAAEAEGNDSDYVRGTLHVALNFWKITPQGCYHARIMSFQLNGRIPPTLTQTVMEQQANMPRVMDAYLTKLKKESPPTQQQVPYKLEYKSIYEAMEQLNKTKATANGHHMDRTESKIASFRSVQHALSMPLAVEKEAMALLAPLLLYKIVSMMSVRLGSFVFVVGILVALRWIVTNHLMTVFRILPKAHQKKLASSVSAKGSTSCRFNIDLKGVLRFLANEKKSGDDLPSDKSNEILISHILVRALGKAMNQLSHLAARKYPGMPPLYAVDVIFHDHKTGKAIWVDRPDEMTVQEIADYFSVDQPAKKFWQIATGPTCHVFTSPDSDHAQVDLDVNLEGVPITVCVSGIRLEKEHRQPSLCVAISIPLTDIVECRAFAETVQTLIQFPEMLD